MKSRRTIASGSLSALCLMAAPGCDEKPVVASPKPFASQSARPVPTTPAPADLAALVGPHRPLAELLVVGSTRLWGFPVPRKDALAEWRKLRAQTDRSGFYPLIVTGSLLSVAVEYNDKPTPPSSILEQARSIDARSWLRDRAERCLADSEHQFDFTRSGKVSAEPDGFQTLTDAENPANPWSILLIPTRNPWEVFAYLDFGGWNEYPTADVHVAVMKHWFDRYAAEPVIVTDDVIEMAVGSPPTTVPACDELAIEQFGYTYGDLVFQGVETMGNLSTVLQNSPYWYFWWD